MIFYASGAVVDDESLEFVVRHRISLLTSYAYKGAFKRQVPRLPSLLRSTVHRLPYMLDSGAFTAWNKGKTVDREALVAFYNDAHQRFHDCYDLVCVSLDRIPGKQGVPRVPKDYEDAEEESIRNYDYMRRHVTAPLMPVYHDGEPERVLRAYDDAQLIALGANQDLSYAEREAWVSATTAGMEGRKTHGLAMTGTRMLRMTRWYSVDSASWVLWAGMGAIAWLRHNGALKILAASVESPRRKKMNQHLGTLSPTEQEEMRGTLAEDGFEVERLARDSIERARWNMLVFHRACAWASAQPVVSAQFQQGGLFDD